MVEKILPEEENGAWVGRIWKSEELKTWITDIRGNFHSLPSDQAEKSIETDRCKYNLSKKKQFVCPRVWGVLLRKLPVMSRWGSGSSLIKWTRENIQWAQAARIRVGQRSLIKLKLKIIDANFATEIKV